ncbi:hypothetical protein HK102_012110, partial [Quaeritorhiza haematococci]
MTRPVPAAPPAASRAGGRLVNPALRRGATPLKFSRGAAGARVSGDAAETLAPDVLYELFAARSRKRGRLEADPTPRPPGPIATLGTHQQARLDGMGGRHAWYIEAGTANEALPMERRPSPGSTQFRRGAFPMSFIQRFLERVLRNNPDRMPRTSFDDLSQEQLDAHLRVGRYGSFSLTDAVRPSIGLEVVPREGYRRDVYCDPESGNKMPVLAASVSSDRLFDVFMDLLDPLGEVVDVVM